MSSGPLGHAIKFSSDGDVLVYRMADDRDARSLQVPVHRPASFSSNIAEQSWHVNYEEYFDANDYPVTVAVDVTQDLIALLNLGQGPEG